MELSVDFGASTIDVVKWKNRRIFAMRGFERDLLKDGDLEGFFWKNLKIRSWQIDRLFLTGGKSRKMQPDFCVFQIVNEIEAIGRGGFYFWKKELKASDFFQKKNSGNKTCGKIFQENRRRFFLQKYKKFLVVSMGTGTCMVKVTVDDSVKKGGEIFGAQELLKIEHVGGTGIGGGTFLALCKELLGETDIRRLVAMFRRGDAGKVDLSVKEIVGSGIGMVPASGTASNLAKLTREIHFSKADKAAGIANLIGQTIGTAAVFAAMAGQIDLVILTGKLTRIDRIMETIFEVAKVYSIPMLVPKDAEYVSAIGAGLCRC